MLSFRTRAQLPKWLRKRHFNWHFKPVQPLTKSGGPHTDVPRPFGYCHGLVAELYEFVSAGIVHLLQLRGPTAIRRLVVAVNVISLKAMIWSRFRPHVGKEIGEAVPSLADLNTSAAVILERFIGLLRTALSHSHPRIMLWSSGQAMSPSSRAGLLVSETAARVSVTGPNVWATESNLCPAVAFEPPKQTTARRQICRLDPNQSSKSSAGHVRALHSMHVAANNTNVNDWRAKC